VSLDVYLYQAGGAPAAPRSGIFIREDGAMKEISREEWGERFPGREPVVSSVTENDPDQEVYWRNITHNLTTMADAAGLYRPMWRPDEIGITTAEQLIAPLSDGLMALKDDPERFRKFNPADGWGDYDGLVAFVEDYLGACRRFPSARVEVSR